ncbi:MAG: geranylgeranylglyceryl/heptaprenylglyceryl phosphate synthase [Candidatus Edwardsbacteria bacterium]|jgi:putative glycerol-1-phosphate prenyltransferase|nr:geranylgeranylglyceryl/heptaprenylglyceryl phosphate synthase [Candidatus Edwardsbacteria bacterium]
MSIYDYLQKTARARGACFLVLLDPDKLDPARLRRTGKLIAASGADGILFGTSLMMSGKIDQQIKALKQSSKLPVIIFPGSAYQVSKHADALLFMSLISGRNANLLIEEQVKAAPMVATSGLEAIATGYMLIESGKLTSANYISNTLPIPRDKPDIAVAHALAAKLLGMKLIYMDAGSGAQQPVSEQMISAVAKHSQLPVVVGGGIKTPEDAAVRARAGATAVVVGNVLEQDLNLAKRFARAIQFKTAETRKH